MRGTFTLVTGEPKDRHITVDEAHDGALFFWHFANKHIADRPRTVSFLESGNINL